MTHTITVEAVFENGVLRPVQPLPLAPLQRVTVIVQMPEDPSTWPVDVAAIYQEIAAEDLRLATAFLPTLPETWPRNEEQP